MKKLLLTLTIALIVGTTLNGTDDTKSADSLTKNITISNLYGEELMVFLTTIDNDAILKYRLKDQETITICPSNNIQEMYTLRNYNSRQYKALLAPDQTGWELTAGTKGQDGIPEIIISPITNAKEIEIEPEADQ